MLHSNSPAKITIRPAKSEDIQSILRIIRVTFSETYQIPETHEACLAQADLDLVCDDFRSKYHEALPHRDHRIFVASHNGAVIGFAKISKINNESFLDKLYVLSEYHGSDCGNLLMLNCMKTALVTFNTNQLKLEVWNRNARAINYYKKNNFESTTVNHIKQTSKGTFFGNEMVCANISVAYANLSQHLLLKTIERAIAPYVNISIRVKRGLFAGQLPRDVREIKLELDKMKHDRLYSNKGLSNILTIAGRMGVHHPIAETVKKCCKFLHENTQESKPVDSKSSVPHL